MERLLAVSKRGRGRLWIRFAAALGAPVGFRIVLIDAAREYKWTVHCGNSCYTACSAPGLLSRGCIIDGELVV